MGTKFYFTFILLCICNYSCQNNMERTSEDKKENTMEMDENKSFFITDSNNIKYEIVQVSKNEFKKYKVDNKLIFCNDIFDHYGVTAYKIDDAKVIVEESGRYALYPSMNILLNVLKNYKGSYKRSILFDKNPYGKNFPDMVGTIVTQLFDDLDIDPDVLNREDVLIKLDNAILKNRNELFFEKYFLGFIALIGKYSLQEFKGRWQMVLSDDKVTWNPFIEINNQKVYFADYIREDFFNLKERKPFTEAFETVRHIIRINVLDSSYYQK